MLCKSLHFIFLLLISPVFVNRFGSFKRQTTLKIKPGNMPLFWSTKKFHPPPPPPRPPLAACQQHVGFRDRLGERRTYLSSLPFWLRRLVSSVGRIVDFWFCDPGSNPGFGANYLFLFLFLFFFSHINTHLQLFRL